MTIPREFHSIEQALKEVIKNAEITLDGKSLSFPYKMRHFVYGLR